jgi:hypothetical protein
MEFSSRANKINSSRDWMSINLLRKSNIMYGQYLILRFDWKGTPEKTTKNLNSYINSTLNVFIRFYKAKGLKLDVSHCDFNNPDDAGNNIFRAIEEVAGELSRIKTTVDSQNMFFHVRGVCLYRQGSSFITWIHSDWISRCSLQSMNTIPRLPSILSVAAEEGGVNPLSALRTFRSSRLLSQP